MTDATDVNHSHGAIDQVPLTFNQQSPLGFRFFIKRAPTTNYFVHRINIPGLTLPAADEHTPFITIPQPGDHIEYESLQLTFRISEGLQDYIEIQNWMLAFSHPEMYETLAEQPQYTSMGIKSEILVSILNSAKNVIKNITYHDCWPTQLSGLFFDATMEQVQYLVASAVFRFSTYEFSDP